MAKKRIKVKEHEKLSESNVERVIELLNENKPISKKMACEILNISYNTTRLQTIIDNHISRKEYEKAQRDKNRGKPATEDEIKSVVKAYLEGEPVAEIAKDLFRSPTFVNSLIERLGVPKKETGDDKYIVGLLPDQCVSQEFKKGQVAWSAKYHSPCVVGDEIRNIDYEAKYGCKVYRIYVLEPLDEPVPGFSRVTIGGFCASSIAWDLGNLEHLAKYDIKYSS